MIIPGNDPLKTIMNTHQKKKIPKKKQKKIEELCTHQICVHAPSSKSTTGHYSTIKNCAFCHVNVYNFYHISTTIRLYYDYLFTDYDD